MGKAKKKIGIIGSGSIAYMIALELSVSSEDEIFLIGNHSNKGASQAAGAMLNILSEVDIYNSKLPLMKWKLTNRDIVLQYWKEIEDTLDNYRMYDFPLIYGKGTTIKLDKVSMNSFEQESFNSMRNAALDHSIRVVNRSDEKFNYLDIPDEQSVDPNFLIRSSINKFNKKVNIINKAVKTIKKIKKNYSVTLENESYNFEQIIIACGAWSDRIIRNSPDLIQPKIKSYNDVGTALLLSSEFPHKEQPKIDRIFRTPNRGGTCGIHSVQRCDSVYIGASSRPTHVDMKYPIASSINALISGTQPIVGIDAHDLATDIITGYRPVTEDSYPVIGKLAENVWCVYGTKRDGFTWSPYYAKEIVNMILERESNHKKEWEEILEMCSPQRDFNSFGEVEFCIDAFVNSKKAESYQHNIELTEEELLVFRNIAEETHLKMEKRVGKQIGINPDLIKILNFFN